MREKGNISKNPNLAAAPAIRYWRKNRMLGVQLFSPNDRQAVPYKLRRKEHAVGDNFPLFFATASVTDFEVIQ